MTRIVYVEYRLPAEAGKLPSRWTWDGTVTLSNRGAKPGDILWTAAAGADVETRTPLEFRGRAVRSCRVCGCTDEIACPGGCSWVSADLCSSCGVGDGP